jgi:6-phosphofructokinase 1
MNKYTLGKPRFASTLSHTISDDVRIPERIEIGAEPGIPFKPEAFLAALKQRMP